MGEHCEHRDHPSSAVRSEPSEVTIEKKDRPSLHSEHQTRGDGKPRKRKAERQHLDRPQEGHQRTGPASVTAYGGDTWTVSSTVGGVVGDQIRRSRGVRRRRNIVKRAEKLQTAKVRNEWLLLLSRLTHSTTTVVRLAFLALCITSSDRTTAMRRKMPP